MWSKARTFHRKWTAYGTGTKSEWVNNDKTKISEWIIPVGVCLCAICESQTRLCVRSGHFDHGLWHISDQQSEISAASLTKQKPETNTQSFSSLHLIFHSMQGCLVSWCLSRHVYLYLALILCFINNTTSNWSCVNLSLHQTDISHFSGSCVTFICRKQLQRAKQPSYCQ